MRGAIDLNAPNLKMIRPKPIHRPGNGLVERTLDRLTSGQQPNLSTPSRSHIPRHATEAAAETRGDSTEVSG